MKYTKMFEKGKIGNLELKNRVVMAPLAMGINNLDSSVSEEMITYYKERALGGVGLIICENTRVNDYSGVAAHRQMSVSRDDLIPGLTKLADEIHECGTALFAQLHHPGRETFSSLNQDKPVVSSSDRSCGVCGQETRALETSEVKELIQDFINGAVRAQKAGFDGVELHGAHGYLISQFLSPYTNNRTDCYGGSFENRFNFVKEICEGIKEACGKDYILSVRLTVDELLAPNGVSDYLTLDMGLKVCQELEKVGVDVINVSNGIYESFNSLSEPMTYNQGCRSSLIKTIKEGVSIPVIAVNMIKEPWYAEKMLETNLVDFVGLGRALVADEKWVEKAYNGQEEDINRCISCTFCFETLVADAIMGDKPVKCAVNARAGRETVYPDYPQVEAGKTVVVVGAGVAGLEASRVLAKRGYEVVVLEKSYQAGGQINVANKPSDKTKINWIVEYLLTQCHKLGVEIKYNTMATKEAIAAYNPYGVIVATGGAPVVPGSIKGVTLPNVYTIDDVLLENADLNGKNAVVIGSGATGLETTEFLCEKGKEVTLVEMQDEIGKGVYVQHFLDAMDRLKEFPINRMPSTKLVEITETGVVVENVDTKETTTISADMVVLSVGVRSVDTLSAACKEVCDNVVVVGDASAVGRIESAVRTAFEAAYSL